MADDVAITAGSGTNIGADERTINSVSVKLQRVIDIANSTLANGQVTMSSTEATIVAAQATRKSVLIINRQLVPVWIGIATVTTSNGLRLDPGDAAVITTTALIQGITSAAYSASGDAKVHYLETYDS